MPGSCAQLIETLGFGGAENLAVRIANGLAGLGWESHIIVTGDHTPLDRFVAPDVRVHRLGVERAPIGRPLRFVGSVLEGYRELRQVIAANGVSVVQTHLPGANFWGIVPGAGSGAQFIPTIHNNREFEYGDADHPLRRRFRMGAYRRLLGRCRASVAVSGEVRESMGRQLGLRPSTMERMHVVPNGVPIPELLEQGERYRIRARYGLAADDHVVLAAGRFTPQKNLHVLIEAAQELTAAQPGCRFVVAGDGPQREEIMAGASAAGLDRVVVFPGNITDLPELMAAADIFVLPSLWEGLPLVLLEAMAAGAACVGTRISGISEVLTDGETGLLVEPDDSSALAAAIGRLAEDSDLRAALGADGRGLVERRFSFARVVADLDRIYRGAAGLTA